MRIRGNRSTSDQGFWPQTLKWFQSRRGFTQIMMGFGLGFVLAGLLAIGYKLGGWKYIDPLAASLSAQVKEIEKEVVKNDLPTLYLDIGFEEFQSMANQRDEALSTGILILDEEDWARAEIRFQGETIPVRVRLKGDWTDHLGEKKWSFRVKTRGDATLMGMRAFSVQSPATRQYLNEWLYLKDLRRNGILAPRYTFVNVTVNGENWGLYALEESFSKELLESQGRREGVIVRFSEDLLWRYRALTYDNSEPNVLLGLQSCWLDPISRVFQERAFAQVDEFNSTRIRNDPVLSEQSDTALGLLQGFQRDKISSAEVFDTKLMGRYLAHTNLWAAQHGTFWHNQRYYYNPLTSRLEPIGYDAEPLIRADAPFVNLGHYGDLSVMESYAQEVKRISQPEYLEELEAAYLEEFERYQSILASEFPDSALAPPWEALKKRQRVLRTSLHPPQTVHAYQVGGAESSTVNLKIGNIVQYPVVLRQLRIGERGVDIRSDWVLAADYSLLEEVGNSSVILESAQGSIGPKYITLQIPSAIVDSLLPTGTTLYSNTLQLTTGLYGAEGEITVAVQQHYPAVLSARLTPPQPSIEEALARYPFLRLSEEPNFLSLEPGSWKVNGDLVLPDGFGLMATQSVTLTFDSEALLYANGPLLLSGPDDERIYLEPKQDTWAGLIVLQAGSEAVSVLHNVDILGTTGIRREGWMTTGGVTFYESPVVLDHCRLLDSSAEDAINVVRADFEFLDTEFGNTASDAFDGDFVNGRIENCTFHDIRGDGIDTSGSQIEIQNVNLLRVYDKGISAGEASRVTVTNVNAKNVAIAITSKDLSQVEASQVNISRVWIAGLAAYTKKMEYGPATIEASNVIFEDVPSQSLVQTGSSAVINGIEAQTSDLNVEELYTRLETIAGMHWLDYQVGNAITLAGYTLTSSELPPGGELSLYLYWQAESQPDKDYTVFVHILDSSDQFLTQQDVMPADGKALTSRWVPGEFVEDHHRISLPMDMQAGEYHIVVGMYNWRTGERLPIYDRSRVAIPNASIVLGQTLTVIP